MKYLLTTALLVFLSLTGLAQQIGETPDGTLQFRSRITGVTSPYSTTAWSAARLAAKVDLSAYNTFRATQAATDAAQNVDINSRLLTSRYESFTSAQAATNAAKLDATTFSTYAGSQAALDNDQNDQVAARLALSQFNSYSATQAATDAAQNAALNNRLPTTSFNSYTATQQATDAAQNTDIGSRLQTSQFNTYTTAQGTTNAAKLNTTTFNSHTATQAGTDAAQNTDIGSRLLATAFNSYTNAQSSTDAGQNTNLTNQISAYQSYTTANNNRVGALESQVSSMTGTGGGGVTTTQFNSYTSAQATTNGAKVNTSDFTSYTNTQATTNANKANLNGGNSFSGNNTFAGSLTITQNVSLSNVTASGTLDGRALLLGNTSNSFQQSSGFVMSPGSTPVLRAWAPGATSIWATNNSTPVIRVFDTGKVTINSATNPTADLTVGGSLSVTGAVTLTGPFASSAVSQSLTALQTQMNSMTGTNGSLNPAIVTVKTATVAALQTAVNSVTASGMTVRIDVPAIVWGDAERVDINSKTNFTLDLNGATFSATSARTMIYLGGTSQNLRITSKSGMGRILNNSPTLPYNATYGYYGTISTLEDAQINGFELDHIEGTTPNADQDFILNVTYRDVAGNNGGTSIIRNMNVHHCYFHDIGRMVWESINGGAKYLDLTVRNYDPKFTNNHVERTGLKSAEGYGMVVSWDGAGDGGVCADNTIRDAKGNAIEIVNGKNMVVTGNTIVDSPSNLTGCNGISITDNRRFLTSHITVTGNTIDVKKRPIQIREATYVTVTGNVFKSQSSASDFVVKRCRISGNTFQALTPTEPVVVFQASNDNNQWWTSTENTFQGNTVTNHNPAKPSGYTGPFQLVRLTSGSQKNLISENFLIQDPAATSFPYIEHINNSDASLNHMGTNFTRVARSLGYGD